MNQLMYFCKFIYVIPTKLIIYSIFMHLYVDKHENNLPNNINKI